MWKINLSLRLSSGFLKTTVREKNILRSESVHLWFGILQKNKKTINILFRPVFTNYQENMVEKIKGCDFVFLLHG